MRDLLQEKKYLYVCWISIGTAPSDHATWPGSLLAFTSPFLPILLFGTHTGMADAAFSYALAIRRDTQMTKEALLKFAKESW